MVMNTDFEKIEGTVEAWENGTLGCDKKYARVDDKASEEMIDESLGLQLISIRLQKSLIADLKDIAKMNGIGYQPLVKQILHRFVNAEKKMIIQQAISDAVKENQNKTYELYELDESLTPSVRKYG